MVPLTQLGTESRGSSLNCTIIIHGVHQSNKAPIHTIGGLIRALRWVSMAVTEQPECRRVADIVLHTQPYWVDARDNELMGEKLQQQGKCVTRADGAVGASNHDSRACHTRSSFVQFS